MNFRKLVTVIMVILVTLATFAFVAAGITALYTGIIYISWTGLHAMEVLDEPQPFMQMWPIVALATICVALVKNLIFTNVKKQDNT